MRQITPLVLLLGLLLTRCNDEKKDSSTTTSNNSNNTTTATEEKASNDNATVSTNGSNSIIGTWKLHLDAYDDNNNKLLDPEERSKATPNNMSYQFKPDGSCLIQGMFKGRYEMKKENSHDYVIVYREKIAGEEDDDPLPEKFRILSVSSVELVLLMQESAYDNTIWIFKRV